MAPFLSENEDFLPKGEDWIAVLGAPACADGNASAAIRRRTARALELFRKRPASRLLLLGAAVANVHPEARVMGEWLQARGVPTSAIWIETRTRSTRDQAELLTRLCRARRPRSLIVVSDRSHLFRTRLLFLFHGHRAPGLVLRGARRPKRLKTRLKMMVYESVNIARESLHFASKGLRKRWEK